MLTLGTPGGVAEDLEGTNGVAVGDKTVSAVHAGVEEDQYQLKRRNQLTEKKESQPLVVSGFPDDSCPARPFSRTASAFRPFR